MKRILETISEEKVIRGNPLWKIQSIPEEQTILQFDRDQAHLNMKFHPNDAKIQKIALLAIG